MRAQLVCVREHKSVNTSVEGQLVYVHENKSLNTSVEGQA